MIGVVCAMDSEADVVRDQMDVETVNTVSGKAIMQGSFLGKEVVVIVCGIGKVNAAIGTQILIDLYKVESIVNLGVAGGVSERVSLTEVYAISHAAQYDFDLSEINGTQIGTLDEFAENYLPLALSKADTKVRKIASGDRFNDNAADYILIKDYFGADIRDMECAAIVQTATHAGVPVYAFKAISDMADGTSTAEQYKRNRSLALLNLKAELHEIFPLL